MNPDVNRGTMTLRLRVVSDQRRSLGDRGSIVFSVDGGSIGRSADNDWVLPDPHRYVSAHHARVQYRDGQYFLQDVSTNGVFINDEQEPLAKRGSDGYRLQNGDVIRLGDYQVVVALEQDSEQAPAHANGVSPVPTSIHALKSFGRAAQTDIGAMLDLEELLLPDSSPSAESFQPVNAYGQAVLQAPAPALGARMALATKPLPNPEPDEDSLARRVAKLAKAAAAGREAKPVAANGAALYDVHTGLQAFCRGAGFDADRLPVDAQTRLLHVAGQLLREALVGLKELERSRHEIRNRFRIELQPPEPDDPRPSLARSTVDDLLVDLLKKHESRRIDAVQWLRETVAEFKQHENATAQSTRAAFIEFIGRLDPAELEARFERAARRGVAKSADKAQYWDLFTTFYRNLIEMPGDHLPHTFVEAFATAYRDYFTKKPPSPT
jgi:type VI secretion system FHA domain protein